MLDGDWSSDVCSSDLFQDLFEPRRGAQVLVVTFIAMLELARERLLEITQAEAFAHIYVRLAYAPA
jgi:segregation and condensation protein A